MAIAFPAGAVVNDVYTEGERSWRYNGTTWDKINISQTVHSDIAPPNPTDGQFWIDTNTAQIYYGSGGNWVQLSTSTHTHQV